MDEGRRAVQATSVRLYTFFFSDNKDIIIFTKSEFEQTMG